VGRLRAAALLGASALLLAVAVGCGSGASAPSTPTSTATSAPNPSRTVAPTAQSTISATSTLSVIGVPGDGGEAAGIAIAHAYLSASDTPILTVNGTKVSARDFAVMKQIVKTNIARMQQLAQRITPDDPSAAVVVPRLQLMQGAKVGDIALGGLISREALYQEAERQGLAPSAAEISAYVEQQRKLTNQAGAGTTPHGIEQVLGDTYWTTYLPHQARYVLAEENLQQKQGQDLQHTIQSGLGLRFKQAWAQMEGDLVRAAKVKMLDPQVLGTATVEGAKAYVDKALQLTAAGS